MTFYYQAVASFRFNEFGDSDFRSRSEAITLAADREFDFAESGGSIRTIGFSCETELEVFQLKEKLDSLKPVGISSEVKRYQLSPW